MTSKDLSEDEAEILISRLEAIAIPMGVWQKLKGKKKYEDLGERKGMTAPSKLRLIEILWKNISYVHDSHKREQALRKFIFKIAHVDDLTFLTADGADKVINALRHIKRRHGQPPRPAATPVVTTGDKKETQVYRDRSNNF